MAHYVCTFRDLTQILMCRDLQDPQTIDDYRRLMPEQIDLVYSDPPWNPGNATYWRTHAGMDPCVSYDRFLDAWVSVVVEGIRRGAADVLVEQSRIHAHRHMLMAASVRNPGWALPLLEAFKVAYSGGENVLMHFGHNPLMTDPTGMTGDWMTLRACAGIDAFPRWALDPCVGKGMTSRVCHAFGWSLIGSELNPKRLTITLKWLERQGYQVEERS